MKTTQVRTMYGLRFLLALVVSLVLGIASARADTAIYQILIDTDHNPATGCTLNTTQGSFAGAERRLLTAVSFGNGPATVSGVQLQNCVGGAFGPPVWSSPGGWPVGQGSNADIIETLLPLSALGGAASLRLGVVAEANGSLDTLFLSNGQGNGPSIDFPLPGGGGGAGPFDPPQAIPLLHPWAILGLALLLVGLAGYGLRRHRGLLAVLLLAATIGGVGLAWAAMQLDGQTGDWNGRSPLATDPRGDALGMADLLALYAKVEGQWLHFRLDAAGAGPAPANQAPQVNAGNDQTITLPSNSVNLAGSVNDDGLPNPPAQVTLTWSKSSGPGSVTFGNVNSANTSAQFSTDGTYVLHLDAFDGQLHGGDDVQITVNPAPAPAVNQAVLGPLAGAQINAYRLNALDTPVEGPITANPSLTDLALAGTFSLALTAVPDDEWILVTASGGMDIDANDDGLLDPTPTANQGTLHALAKASDWRAGGVRINVLTEIAWQELAERVASGQIADLDARLRWLVNNLFAGDINGDGDLNYLDLTAFVPGSAAFRKSLAFPFATFLVKNGAGRSLFDEIHDGLKNAERDWITAYFGDRLQIPPVPEIVGVSFEVQLPANREGLLGQDLLISSLVSSGAQILDQGATLMIAKDAAGHSVLLAFALPGQVAQFSPRSTALALAMLALGGPRDVQGFTELAGKVTAQAGFDSLVVAIENTLKADPFFLDRLMTYVDLVAQVKSVVAGVKAAASAASAAFQARALAPMVLAAESSLPITKQDFYCFWLITCSPWHESEPWDWYGDAKGVEALWPDNLFEWILTLNTGGASALGDAYITELLPDFTHVPFLAVAHNTQTEIGLANPGAANYAFELIAGDGTVADWFLTPRNSTVFDKLLNSGAAQRSLFSVANLGHPPALGSNVTHVRFNKRDLLMRVLNSLNGALSVVNMLSDFSDVTQGVELMVANDQAVSTLRDCILLFAAGLPDELYWDASEPNNLGGQFLGFMKTDLLSIVSTLASPGVITCMDAALKVVGREGWEKIFAKAVAKTNLEALLNLTPVGWTKIALDGANDLVPVMTSVLWPWSNQQDYYLTWGRDAANNPILIGVSTTPPPEAPPEHPQALFTAMQNPGEGLIVHFDASGSRVDPRAAPNFTWDFGDGAQGSGEQASHTYAGPGTRQVRLTLNDGLGQTAERTATIQVRNGVAPVIQSMQCRLDPNVARRVLVDAVVTDGDGDLAELQWWRAPLVFEVAPAEITTPDITQVALDYPDNGATVFAPTLRARDAAGNEAVRTCTVVTTGDTVVFSNAACGTNANAGPFPYVTHSVGFLWDATSTLTLDTVDLRPTATSGSKFSLEIYEVSTKTDNLTNLVARSLNQHEYVLGRPWATFYFLSDVTLAFGHSYIFLLNLKVGGELGLNGSVGCPPLGKGLGAYDGDEQLVTWVDMNFMPYVKLSNIVMSGRSMLNDTGLTWGGEYPSGNNATCTSGTTDIGAQDCSRGRDVTHNDDSDGHAGFSFTKLDANGNPLPASATSWDCVRDNVTGLIWENKTDDGGLRDADWTYTSYDSAYNDGPDSPAYPPANVGPDGVWAGPVDTGVGSGSDNCANPSKICTTEQYVADVNAVGLCGAHDWRMPTVKELENIVRRDRYNPAIDSAWFPNTRSTWFWSSSPNAYFEDSAWYVYLGNGYAYYNFATFGPREDDGALRLVRGGD